jgi:hypothetical protein
MRSCEYLKVPDSDKRRTKLLTLHNLRFFQARIQLLHSDPNLRLADSISINFEFKKNNMRDAIITMHRTGDSILCPVIAWASIVHRIRALPDTVDTSPVCTCQRADGTLGLVISK